MNTSPHIPPFWEGISYFWSLHPGGHSSHTGKFDKTSIPHPLPLSSDCSKSGSWRRPEGHHLYGPAFRSGLTVAPGQNLQSHHITMMCSYPFCSPGTLGPMASSLGMCGHLFRMPQFLSEPGGNVYNLACSFDAQLQNQATGSSALSMPPQHALCTMLSRSGESPLSKLHSGHHSTLHVTSSITCFPKEDMDGQHPRALSELLPDTHCLPSRPLQLKLGYHNLPAILSFKVKQPSVTLFGLVSLGAQGGPFKTPAKLLDPSVHQAIVGLI
jgi:hypothetical protein